jgi:hypothetical protein
MPFKNSISAYLDDGEELLVCDGVFVGLGQNVGVDLLQESRASHSALAVAPEPRNRRYQHRIERREFQSENLVS